MQTRSFIHIALALGLASAVSLNVQAEQRRPNSVAARVAAPAAAPRAVAPAAQPVELPFKAARSGPGVVPLQKHCNTVSSCNDLIAECHGAGGQWQPGGFNRRGETTHGDCFID